MAAAAAASEPPAPEETQCVLCMSNMGVPAYQPDAKGVDSDGSADEGDTKVKAVGGRRATYTRRCGHTFHASCIVKHMRRDTRCPVCHATEEKGEEGGESSAPAASVPGRMPMPMPYNLPFFNRGFRSSSDSDDDDDEFSTDHVWRIRMPPYGAAAGSGAGSGAGSNSGSSPNPAVLPPAGPGVYTTGSVTTSGRDGTVVTRGAVTVYVPAPVPPPPPAARAAPPPPLPTAPAVSRILDGLAIPLVLPPRTDTTAWVVDLGLPLTSCFRRPPRAPAPAFRRLDIRMPADIYDAFNRLAPQACRVEMPTDTSYEPTYFTTAIVHYARGDPYNVNCTWFYTRADGWRYANDALLFPEHEYRLLLTWYPEAPHVGVRALAPYDDGDAMMEDLHARLVTSDAAAVAAAEAEAAGLRVMMTAPITAAGTGAVASAGAVAGAVVVPEIEETETETDPGPRVPSLTVPDAGGRAHLRLLSDLVLAPPRDGETNATAILRHLERGHNPWAVFYAATDGSEVAFMRHDNDLRVAVTRGRDRDEHAVPWTTELEALVQTMMRAVPMPIPPIPMPNGRPRVPPVPAPAPAPVPVPVSAPMPAPIASDALYRPPVKPAQAPAPAPMPASTHQTEPVRAPLPLPIPSPHAPHAPAPPPPTSISTSAPVDEREHRRQLQLCAAQRRLAAAKEDRTNLFGRE